MNNLRKAKWNETNPRISRIIYCFIRFKNETMNFQAQMCLCKNMHGTQLLKQYEAIKKL